MKLVSLLGDPHFGASYSMGGINHNSQVNNRLLDYCGTFDYAIDNVLNNNVPHMIILGDSFEHRRPSPVELSLFAKRLFRLSQQGVHVHIIVGNHDLIRSNKTTTLDVFKQLQLPNIHVYSAITSKLLHDRKKENFVNVVFLPYRSKHMLKLRTNEEATEYVKERLGYELEENCDSNYPTILVGHMTVKGSDISHLLLDYDISSEIILPKELFNKFDLTCLGHIHNFEIIDEEKNIINLGSMERNNFGDMGVKKKTMVIDVDNNKLSYDVNDLPVREIYDLQIDCTQIPPDQIMKMILQSLKKFNKKNNLEQSIMRVRIFVSNLNFNEIDLQKIRKYLRGKKLFYCTGINVTTVTMRQPRRASITERSSDIDAFKGYLDLVVDDKEFKSLLLEKGEQIILRGGAS